jgi:Zn-dependent protease
MKGVITYPLSGAKLGMLLMATLGIAYFMDGSGQTIFGSDIYKIDIGLPKDPLFLFESVFQGGVLVNVVMCVFNLFPIPPLDGGRILVGLLPMRPALAVSRLEPWGFFIVLGLVFTGIIGSLWMEPLMAFFKYLLYLITLPLQMIV